MIQLTRPFVGSFDLDHLDVWWEVEDTVEDILLYSFYVQRSESPEGPWTTLVGPLKDKWRFRDTSVNQLNRSRSYFYRIRAVEDATSVEVFSPASRKEAEQDLIGSEISRRFLLLLREHIGRKVVLYPVRTSGMRCPHCWDSILRKPLVERCLTCFSTTYAGGYYSPIKTHMQIDPHAEPTQVTGGGETQDTKTTARAFPYPPIKPNDILVEAENKRWQVMLATPTQKLRAAAHIELQLHMLPPGDMAYKLPVPVDILNWDPSPGRSFTNPHHVEALGTRDIELENVLGTYGYPYTK